MRKIVLFFLLFYAFQPAFADQPAVAVPADFVYNKGQWPRQVLYSAELPQGWLFLEQNRLVYNFLEPDYFNLEAGQNPVARKKEQYQGHSFRVRFIGANPQKVAAQNKLPGYRNYFIGNKASQWATEVNAYTEVYYSQLFPLVDLRLYNSAKNLKYDYIVAPQGNPDNIKMQYEGVQSLALKNGILHIKTTINEIREEKPYAYQLINGQQHEVACEFTLDRQVVGFKVTGHYNPAIALVIDPIVIFSTYTGTTTGISANCTTADASGNAYSGGYLIGTQYPVTVGAYQTTRLGGNVAISKFNAAGNTLLYATFLGGDGSEYPLAMTVNKQNELVMLGNTNSFNFPATQSAYDRFLAATNGSDYFIAKLSGNGSRLVAATYLGGNQAEGGTLASIPSGLTLDEAGNIYVGGSTESVNFPVVNGYQPEKKESYDGVVVKFDPSLSSILWSSFIGGNLTDIISDIEVGPSGQVYVAGYTYSHNFPATAGAIKTTLTGNKDGFVAVFNASGTQLTACTYLGTTSDDLVQFISLDKAENVYAAGFTRGSYAITAGTFGTITGQQGYFIHKLNPTLSGTVFSTHLGSTAASFNDPVPTAFHVDNCENIYLSAYSLSSAPTTPDAFEKNQKSLYLCQLAPDAKELIFGSYFGSNVINHIHLANHSTITDEGILYQIECTSSAGYEVSPTSYSFKKTDFYDGAVSKIKFSPVSDISFKADFTYTLSTCAPATVKFNNTSINGISYVWYFDDNTGESTEAAPTHTFEEPGKYRVRLISNNPTSCLVSDTTYAVLKIDRPPVSALPAINLYLCGSSIEVDVGIAGFKYRWSTGDTTRAINIAQPGTYLVEVSNATCSITDSITVKPPAALQVPNIITPNLDGKNDFLVIRNTSINPKLKIFNRWGNLVYQNDNYQNNWNGNQLNAGTYFYTLESAELCNRIIKGWLEIVR